MFSLASQGLLVTAIPEGYVSAVHLLRNRKLSREDFLCEVRGESAPGHEAGSLSGRPAGDNDVQIAMEGKPGFVKQWHISKKKGCGTRFTGLLL